MSGSGHSAGTVPRHFGRAPSSSEAQPACGANPAGTSRTEPESAGWIARPVSLSTSSPVSRTRGYRPAGVPASMQVVTWNDQGAVDARGILAYSQSEEADSPYVVDQTQLYSQKQWLKLPFTEQEIAADPELRTLELKGS